MLRSVLVSAIGIGILLAGPALTGCTGDGQPTLLPNSDPALQKSSAQFAADAARRCYESTAPKADITDARAQYTLMGRHFDVINLSNADWNNVEVWVNQQYVVFVPRMAPNVDYALDFELFYDRDGHHFQTNDGKNPVQTLQVFRNGKMYKFPLTLD